MKRSKLLPSGPVSIPFGARVQTTFYFITLVGWPGVLQVTVPQPALRDDSSRCSHWDMPLWEASPTYPGERMMHGSLYHHCFQLHAVEVMVKPWVLPSLLS